MKSYKSSQRVIIIFLTLFIMACCFLIVRLEIKAANLQSRWDEHQKSLKKNEDVLYDLERFVRDVKSGILKLSLGKSLLVLFDDRIEGSCGENDLIIADDMISMVSRGQNKASGFLLSPNGGQMSSSVGNNKAFIELDKGKIGVQGSGNINIEGKILKMESASGKCEIIIAEEDIHIVCAPSNGPMFGVLFSSATQSISINTNHASLTLAKDAIHFEADGDINITSKNGNVNIKGKKVKVNE